MADALYDLWILPEVEALAAHAAAHPSPVAVIAHGAQSTRCRECGNAWRDAWLAIHAATPAMTPADAGNLLTEWAEAIAETHGIVTSGLRLALHA